MDERKNLNHAPTSGGERTRNRAIRPFRIPSILEKELSHDVQSAPDAPELTESVEVSPINATVHSTVSSEPPETGDDMQETSATAPLASHSHLYVETASTLAEAPETSDDEPEKSAAASLASSSQARDESVVFDELSDIVDNVAVETVAQSEKAGVGDEPAPPSFVRKRRKFRISKKIVSAQDQVREERGVKKLTIPLRYKTLEEAMVGLRDFHPLPFELILKQTPHHATWLMTQIKGVRTKQELEELAYSLSHKDLSLLFTTLSTKTRRDEVDQIMNLIRLRASHYLYLCGWLTLQYCYPRSSISRALSDLCTILEDLAYVKENRRQHQRYQRGPLALPVVSIGKGRIIWTRVPLISQISLPNSRHFIADIVTEMIETKVEPEAFFREYAIIPGQPLANAIEIRYNEMVTGVAANPLLSSNFFDRFRR